MRIFIIWIGLLLPMLAISQLDTSYFIMPIKHEVKMSGSFGELRTNHFHAGIDLKSSKGVDGDPIIAAANGYISRVNVQYGGYGKALYINHDNGYTTVYAHFSEYTPSIDSLVSAIQHETQNHTIDYYPEPDDYTVQQGEIIGYMGNTGHSYGTHLHFELRKTADELPINPYGFGLGATDTKAPSLFKIGVHEMNSQYVDIHFNSKDIKDNQLEQPVVVESDIVGISIQAFDKMDGANNLNGVYDIKMYVDDSLYFHHTMDHFSFEDTRFINSHLDYEQKRKNDISYTRCHVLPGNPLTFYNFLKNKGFIQVNNGEIRQVRIEVGDYYKNTSTVDFKLIKKRDGKNVSPSYHKMIHYNKADTFTIGHAKLAFDVKSLDRNLLLNYKERVGEDKINLIIGNKYTPIFRPYKLRYDVSHIDSTQRGKLVILYDNDKQEVSYGGSTSEATFEVDLYSLGNFKIVLDTIPPTIIGKNITNNMPDAGSIFLEVEDNYEAKGTGRDPAMEIFIDGVWQVASFSYITNTLTIPYKGLESGKHNILVTATDHSGNRKEFYQEFNIL